MKPTLCVSYSLFTTLNPDLTKTELKLAHSNIKHKHIQNIIFFKCLDWLRSKELYIKIDDLQYYYNVSVTDHENEYEPHPEFKHTYLTQAVVNLCEYFNEH